jgi:uncharacterized protein
MTAHAPTASKGNTVPHPPVDDGDLLFTADARLLELEPAGLPAQVLAGAPTTSERVLVYSDHVAIGVWEVQPGSWRSQKGAGEHEYIVVLDGHGTVTADGGAAISLSPGAIVSFPPSTPLTWVIEETLRKAYVIITAEEEIDATS